MASIIRISRFSGIWEEVYECEHCEAAGQCEVEIAVADYENGGYIKTGTGECPVCHGRGYVEIEDEDEA